MDRREGELLSYPKANRKGRLAGRHPRHAVKLSWSWLSHLRMKYEVFPCMGTVDRVRCPPSLVFLAIPVQLQLAFMRAHCALCRPRWSHLGSKYLKCLTR